MYKLVKNLLSKEMCELLANEVKILRDIDYHEDPTGIWDDPLVKDCYGYGAGVGSEALLLMLNEKANEFWQKELVPTYSYCRIYYNGNFMPLHTDRPSCEHSITITLQKDKDYPIYMDGTPVEMEVGDAVFYKGLEVDHERKKYNGKEHICVFLHYVDKDGEYKDYKFDRRKYIGQREGI